jgi:hypothetical protein
MGEAAVNCPRKNHRSLIVAIIMLLLTSSFLRAQPILSEFMAANTSVLADADGAFPDWIELHNPDGLPINLTGWYLTDSATNLTKWQFPATVLPAGGYLVVFASNKNRTEPGKELHTNFALSAGGEYLALVRPDGVSVASEFAPTFPAQTDNVSYGVLPGPQGGYQGVGFLGTPSPGRANTLGVAGGLSDYVSFSREPGPFSTAFTLSLSGAGAGQVIRYVVTSATAAGTTTDPVATSPEFTEAITVDRSMLIRAAVFAADGSSRGPVTTAYFAKLDASVASFSSQLPVLVLDNLGAGGMAKDGVDHPSWMYVYAPAAAGRPTFLSGPGQITPLTATVRGSSSAEFPKKGYNLKLTDPSGDPKPQPLLDLASHEKWALVAPWSFDQGYINNAYIYALSNRMGRWAPRTRFAEVFFNTGGNSIDSADYAGIYVITDRVEVGSARVNVTPLAKSDLSPATVTGSYLLKIDDPDPDEFSWRTRRGVPQNGHSSIVLVAPKADDIAPAQTDYIVDYVQQMEDALASDLAAGFSRRTHLDYIDRGSWVDHHILNTFAANPDAFERSAYFTKDRDGKLKAGPVWDFDRAMGSHWDERSYRHDVWSGLGAVDVWKSGWWGMIAQDPEFIQDWVDRWQALRRGTLSNSSLLSLVDTQTGEIGLDAALRDSTKWPDNASLRGSYAAQIDYIKYWVTRRAEWIDAQFSLPPQVANDGTTLTFTAPAGAELIYTLDGSDPRSLGGDIAPNAKISAGPLQVPTTANVHVRAYRTDLKGVFPSSPWSAAIGDRASTPLRPAARIVNISSRALVGSGENALIAGVVVADTHAKRYLARAVGPGLAAFGASGVVPDPQLSIYTPEGVELFRNNGWLNGPDAALLPTFAKSVGAFPLSPSSLDSALANRLNAGAYTVQVSTPADQPGIGLAELYELDANGRTVNLSTRARVRGGEGVMIGGFVVQGPAYKRILLRAIGPTLAAFGVETALADTVLTVYSGSTVVASNDRWEAAPEVAALKTATERAGAFALAANSEDAALLLTLPPGAYTVEVRGKGEAEGVALLEIYDVP